LIFILFCGSRGGGRSQTRGKATATALTHSDLIAALFKLSEALVLGALHDSLIVVFIRVRFAIALEEVAVVMKAQW
jgi:hypothetical protein